MQLRFKLANILINMSTALAFDNRHPAVLFMLFLSEIVCVDEAKYNVFEMYTSD